MTSVDAAQVAESALIAARRAGAEDADAWAERRHTRRIVVWREAVEELGEAVSCGVGVRAFVGGSYGFAFASGFDRQAVADAARAAVELARVADPEPGCGLPESCGETAIEGLADARLREHTVEDCVELTRRCERAARDHPRVSEVEHVVYQDAWTEIALANSRDFTASFTASSAWLYCTAFAGDGADRMTGFGLALARSPAGLDAAAAGREAAQRAALLEGAHKPPSRRCPVLLDPFVAAGLIGVLGEMLSAEQVERGRSPFAGCVGKEVAAPTLQISDDATLADGPASAPFDGEGSPARCTRLIEQGRLRGFLHDVRTARRAGTQTTANAVRVAYHSPPAVGPSNTVVEPGELSFTQLLRELDDGLYVTEISGLHSGIDPVSGRFSVGASGVLVRGGELGAPVRELTIAGSLPDLLRGVVAVGRERRWLPVRGSVATPALLVDGLVVSGR